MLQIIYLFVFDIVNVWFFFFFAIDNVHIFIESKVFIFLVLLLRYFQFDVQAYQS